MTNAGYPRRVAMLSVHTSPVDQPGTGDAGGMNVYIAQTARLLAERGTEVEIFTRARRGDDPALTELAPGVLVRTVPAGPFEGLAKQDLPGQLCAFACGVLRTEAGHEPDHYDLVHSHYWLSGQVGWLAAERWHVPLVHTMYTMAKVKNAALADGDSPEPLVRIIGEQQVVAAADGLLANTGDEAAQLVDLYDADPQRINVVPPGVDLSVFTPGDRLAARQRLGLPLDGDLVLFVGRIQPLKAPDVLIRAVAELLAREPWRRRRLTVAVLGGPSGSGLAHPEQLQQLSDALGLAQVVQFRPPVERQVLAQWYRAADLLVMPSYSESFGLVALEAQACGTPVLAARVGGLTSAVRDGVSGVLVDGHHPTDWAAEIGRLLDAPAQRLSLGAAGVRHAARFGWAATVDATLEAYAAARHEHRRRSREGRGLVVPVDAELVSVV